MRGRFLILAALVAAVSSAKAAEKITLRNGFEMRCDHHAVVQDHMRLYMGSGEDNYIEFPAVDITGIQTVKDLPALPAVLPPSAANSPTALKADAKLSPADLHEILAKAGEEHNLDADLLASVVKAESDGNPHAVSRAGAQGLMQLMPKTANDLGVKDSYVPDENVRGGSTYLDSLLVRYHDNLALALAAYNAGPEAVAKYNGIPPYHETRVYVARVIHEFNRRVRAREAQTQSLASASKRMQE